MSAPQENRPPDYCTLEEWVAFWLPRMAPATPAERERANAALGIRTRPWVAAA